MTTLGGSAWPGDWPTLPDVDLLVAMALAACRRSTPAEVCQRALGHALVVEVQLYLETASTEDDADLFFEVRNREPADLRGWLLALLSDLVRHGLDGISAEPLVKRALDRAVEFVDTDSPLAWGAPRL